MINAQLCTKFEFNAEGERDLKIALKTLETLKDLFVKSGYCVDMEINQIACAMNIVESILNGDMF